MDLESWTMKELAELERLSGQGLQAIGDDNAPKARVMTVLAYLTKRREDPKFKLAQAEEMTMAEISAVLGVDLLGTDLDDEDEGKA